MNKYGTEYMGRDLAGKDLIVYGKMNEIGDFELSAFKEKASKAVKKTAKNIKTMELMPV